MERLFGENSVILGMYNPCDKDIGRRYSMEVSVGSKKKELICSAHTNIFNQNKKFCTSIM